MINIGCHLSSSGGYMSMGEHATELKADTFAFFTRNPRGGAAKEIDPLDAMKFDEYKKKYNFGKLVAHAPYTMNLCSAKEDIRQFGREMLADDLKRMEFTPGNYYNFHPGSHTGQGAQIAIPQIADALNTCMFDGMQTIVLLETMAGKGSEVGGTFEELKSIIDEVKFQDRIGVCLDTCHIWDGGFDIVSDLDAVLTKFDQIIGLDRLYAVHLNDSKNPLGARKDRHELIGEGFIGAQALKAVVNHPALQGKPFILETPNDDAGYAREIALIREWNSEV